ncbi:hypothetical protein SFRURICE_003261 [Spodoptera frugiperda]|nr:hypothetical protein SFRURICE_003261 [Spodoptera frugiperda]
MSVLQIGHKCHTMRHAGDVMQAANQSAQRVLVSISCRVPEVSSLFSDPDPVRDRCVLDPRPRPSLHSALGESPGDHSLSPHREPLVPADNITTLGDIQY